MFSNSRFKTESFIKYGPETLEALEEKKPSVLKPNDADLLEKVSSQKSSFLDKARFAALCIKAEGSKVPTFFLYIKYFFSLLISTNRKEIQEKANKMQEYVSDIQSLQAKGMVVENLPLSLNAIKLKETVENNKQQSDTQVAITTNISSPDQQQTVQPTKQQITVEDNKERADQIISNKEIITNRAEIVRLFDSVENYVTQIREKTPRRVATPAEWRGLGLVTDPQTYVHGKINYNKDSLNKKFDKKFAWLAPVEKWTKALKENKLTFGTDKWGLKGRKIFDPNHDISPTTHVNDAAMFIPGVGKTKDDGSDLANMTEVGIIEAQDFYELYVAQNREEHLEDLEKVCDALIEQIGPWKHHGCMVAARLFNHCLALHYITKDQRYMNLYDRVYKEIQDYYEKNKNPNSTAKKPEYYTTELGGYQGIGYSYKKFYSNTRERFASEIKRDKIADGSMTVEEKLNELRTQYQKSQQSHKSSSSTKITVQQQLLNRLQNSQLIKAIKIDEKKLSEWLGDLTQEEAEYFVQFCENWDFTEQNLYTDEDNLYKFIRFIQFNSVQLSCIEEWVKANDQRKFRFPGFSKNEKGRGSSKTMRDLQKKHNLQAGGKGFAAAFPDTFGSTGYYINCVGDGYMHALGTGIAAKNIYNNSCVEKNFWLGREEFFNKRIHELMTQDPEKFECGDINWNQADVNLGRAGGMNAENWKTRNPNSGGGVADGVWIAPKNNTNYQISVDTRWGLHTVGISFDIAAKIQDIDDTNTERRKLHKKVLQDRERELLKHKNNPQQIAAQPTNMLNRASSNNQSQNLDGQITR